MKNLCSILGILALTCACVHSQGTTAGGGGTAGGTANTQAPGPLTLASISISPNPGSQTIPLTLGFTATGTLSNGITVNLTPFASWSSSNTAIASATGLTVTENFQCAGAGTTQITATYLGISGTAALSCIAVLPPTPTPTAVAISPLTPTIPQGQTGGVQFTGTETFSDGSTQNVTGTAAWSSSDTTKAIKGPLTATQEFDCVGTGSATITVTKDSLSANTTLTCSAVLSTITVAPASPSIVAGNQQSFIATCNYTDGSSQTCAAPTWSSSSTAVATITQAGVATGIAAGTSTIQAALGAISGTTVLTVTAPGPPPPTQTSTTISPANKTININTTLQYAATAVFSDGSTQPCTGTTWASTSTGVATISSSGLASAVANGSTTIQGTCGGILGSTTLTVQTPAPTLSSIAVTPTNQTQYNGSSVQYTATGTYSDGSTKDVTTLATWASSSPSVATISATATSSPWPATCVANSGSTNISATIGAVNNSTSLTCQAVSTGTTANAYCTTGGLWIGPTTDGPAALPTACINTALSNTPSPGSVINVASGGNLQSALNSSTCGQIIKLAVGATFTGTFTIPAKSCDAGHWIQIRSAAADGNLPPEGSRLTPCYAGVASLPGRPSYPCAVPTVYTAKIVFNSTGSGPIQFANGANFYRIGPGIEITRSTGTGSVFPLITNAGPTDHIIVDRVWCHGTAQDETQRCMNVNGITYGAVIDSYISDIHCISVTGSCTDSQAISGGTSTTVDGPFKIFDDFIESSGEGTLWGGGSATQVPQNIEVRQNHYFKPLTWLQGQPGFVGATNGNPFVVKNHFELKNGQKVLVEGNIFENVWGGFSQNGYAILLTPKNQAAGTTNLCPICRVSDVTFRYNYSKHSGAGMSLANAPSDNGGLATEGDRYSIHDDVFDDISASKYAGNGVLFQVFNQFNTNVGVLNSITIKHITGFPDSGGTGKIISLGNDTSNPAMFGFTFANNIIGQNPYPIWSTGGTTNCAISDVPLTALNACFPGGYTFNFNAVIAVNQSNFPPSKWPAGNFFPSTVAAVQFANFNGGNGGDYTLLSSSPYHNAGSDGKDLGADIATLNQKIAGVGPSNPSASANWQLVSTPGGATHINNFAVDGSNNWYLADRVSGFWKSTNQGSSWTQINSGLANSDGWSIQYDPITGDLIGSIYNPNYPSAGPVHFYVSTNGGSSWSQITEPAGYTNSSAPARACIISAGPGAVTDCGGLFGPAGNTGMYSTGSNFNSTTLISQGTNSSIYDFFYDVVTGKYLMGTETQGLFQSSDGITFAAISPNSSSLRVGNIKGITYTTSGTPLFTSQGGVWRCDQTTNCASPTNVLGNANTSAGNALYRDSNGSIYEGHNHDTSNAITIYRSLDQGTSWQEWDTGIPTTHLDIAQFIENPSDGKIYAVVVDDSTNAGSIYSTPK